MTQSHLYQIHYDIIFAKIVLFETPFYWLSFGLPEIVQIQKFVMAKRQPRHKMCVSFGNCGFIKGLLVVPLYAHAIGLWYDPHRGVREIGYETLWSCVDKLA